MNTKVPSIKNNFKGKEWMKQMLKINRQNKISFVNKNTHKYSMIIIEILIIIVNLFNQTLPSNRLQSIELSFSNITLIIKRKGYSNVFGDKSDFKPDDIYINNKKQNEVQYSYNLTDENNIVEFIWNKNNINCKYLFFRCSNISKIDLTNFDTSEVTDMQYMFYGCSSLISWNLSNLDTSKVSNMKFMFSSCSSLANIDLSHIDTSEVTNFQSTFANCISLTSLNLSNFDTSKVTYISNMFNGCKNLIYINLKNYNENKLYSKGFTDVFSSIPNNIVICLNKSENEYKIYNELTEKNC